MGRTWGGHGCAVGHGQCSSNRLIAQVELDWLQLQVSTTLISQLVGTYRAGSVVLPNFPFPISPAACPQMPRLLLFLASSDPKLSFCDQSAPIHRLPCSETTTEDVRLHRIHCSCGVPTSRPIFVRHSFAPKSALSPAGKGSQARSFSSLSIDRLVVVTSVFRGARQTRFFVVAHCWSVLPRVLPQTPLALL